MSKLPAILPAAATVLLLAAGGCATKEDVAALRADVVPLSYYFMSRWLEQFAFRTSLEWWMFALPTIAVCMVALLSIGSQSLKTSMSNPIDSLRSE